MVLPGFKGLSVQQFARRFARALQDDVVFDNAAQLAFYLLFSLFPLLFFLVTLSAYLPLEDAVEDVLNRAGSLMPPSALAIIRAQLENLLNEGQPQLLTLSLLVALWSASRGANAFRKALNLAYEVSESRSFIRVNALAIATTVISAVLVPVSFAGMILGGDAGYWLAERVGIGSEFMMVWTWLRWPIIALIIILVAALSYYLLPDVQQRFKYITPGSVTAATLWLITTWGFTQYVEHFSNFELTYGSLGGVIVLMMWLYLSGLVFMIGGEVNAVIEHASREGKRPGARVPGADARREPARAPAGAVKSRSAAWRARLGFRHKRAPEEPARDESLDGHA
jgi:membrane protein